jgi:hypothetical protein
MTTSPKYNVICSTEKLSNGQWTKDACRRGKAWLPDQECLIECFSRRRTLEEDGESFTSPSFVMTVTIHRVRLVAFRLMIKKAMLLTIMG